MNAKLLCTVILAAAVTVGGIAAFGVEMARADGLALEGIEPNTAPLEGGTKVIILGSGFDTSGTMPVKVFFGGEASPSVTVLSAEEVSAAVPPSKSVGPVDIELQNSDGRKATLPRAFCYDDGSSWEAKWYRIKARTAATWRLLVQGGSIMIPLALLSVFGLAWAIHCALIIRPKEMMPRGLLDKLSGHISRGEVHEAISTAERDGSVFSRVAAAALRRAGQPVVKIREAAQAAGSREASHLFQKISYLSNVGVISPMLGLLGTVLGMIMAFKTIGMGEGGRHILLAAAIYKAMITTAAGLSIGIPAMACYYYFRGKLLRTVTDMEQLAEDVVEAVSGLGERE